MIKITEKILNITGPKICLEPLVLLGEKINNLISVVKEQREEITELKRKLIFYQKK